MEGFDRIADSFGDKFLTREGETVEEKVLNRTAVIVLILVSLVSWVLSA